MTLPTISRYRPTDVYKRQPYPHPQAGEDREGIKAGDRVVAYGALTCGICKACREGRDNLCENVGGIMGFHVDGFARDLINMPARLVVPIPSGVSFRDAACAPVAFGTVQHLSLIHISRNSPSCARHITGRRNTNGSCTRQWPRIRA